VNKLLIANRGEIACRIIRSCQLLGIPTVAVYSDADANAAHVALADEAVHIGASTPKKSYLNIPSILDAISTTGANLVHPGYGFLAENAEFARAVIATGARWIGPKPETIIAMGDKEQARNIASRSGVPVLPGSARFSPAVVVNKDVRSFMRPALN
jgi:3-methylcrotonyl-CoA carboxylase alpha subunit